MQAQARDPLSFSLPRRVGTTGNQVQKSTFCVLLGLLGRFFALPKRAAKTTSKKHRKKCENQEFWSPKTLPKSAQNAFKIDIPKNIKVWGYISVFPWNRAPYWDLRLRQEEEAAAENRRDHATKLKVETAARERERQRLWAATQL